MGEVGEDNFHDVMGNAAGRFVRGTCFWRFVVEEALDAGFALMPNGHHTSRDVYPCGANSTRVRAIYVWK